MPIYNTITQSLKLEVRQVRAESLTCLSVEFVRPPLFSYQSGDWLDLCFDDQPSAGVKTFSFSSSPTEASLMITFKRGVSEFKQRLENLQPHDMVRVRQYGNSGFNLNEKYPGTMIAGGIGIAPFRSMIKEAYDTGSTLDLDVIYQSRTDDFPFSKELMTWSKVLSGLKVHYYDSLLKGRIKREAILEITPVSHGSIYYIAGPPAMVESTENFLLARGVAAQDIMDDAFTGY